MPVSTIAQFKKSLRGSWAYLLVSKMSVTPNLPTVITSRFAVCVPANWLMPRFELLGFTAQVDGLADECARQPRIGIGRTDLVGFAAGESGNAERVGEPKTLVDLGIDPQLGALPQPHAGVQRGVPGFPALPAAREALVPI